jgi:ribose transport system substrate-binding protein
MKKIIFLSFVTIMFVGATCFFSASGFAFQSKDQPAFVGDPEEVYYFVDFVSGVDYWVSLYEGFKDIGRQLGVKTVYTGSTKFDINDQVTIFEQVLAKKPTGVFLCPIAGEPFLDLVNQAKADGIPIALYTNGIEGMEYVAYIDHNNELDSAKAADFVGEQLGGKGEVAVFETLGQDNHEKRVFYFIKRLEDKYPGIKVVARANTQHGLETGAEAAKSILQAHPEVDFFFSVSAQSAMGAAISIEEQKAMGTTNARIITFDCNPQVLDMLKAGQIAAAVQPDAYMFGYLGLWSLFVEKHKLMAPMDDRSATGKYVFSLPLVYPSSIIVTKENADYFYSNKYLKNRQSKGFEESAHEMKSPDLPGYWRR